jgi:hypothetical protein
MATARSRTAGPAGTGAPALAALAPTLAQAIAVAKAHVILDGTLLRIDRVGMIGGR